MKKIIKQVLGIQRQYNKMKTQRLLILPLALILLAAFAQAAAYSPEAYGSSVTVSLFYEDVSGSTLTITEGESAGVIVSADSIFEDSMDVTLKLLNSNGNVISTLLDVTTTSDSYSKTLTVSQSAYDVPGVYTLEAKVVGESGQSDKATLILKVVEKEVPPEPPKNNPPKITSTPVTMVNEKASYVYDVDATDPDNDVLTFSLTQSPSFLSINSQTGLISGTAPEVNVDTIFPVIVQVSDGKGGSDSQSYQITVKNIPEPPKNNPPVITSTPVTMVNEKTQYTYDVEATDADNDALSFSLTETPNFLSIDSSTGLITGTAPEVSADTMFDITVKVSDSKGGSDTQSYVLTVKNIKEPPKNNAPVAKDQSVTTKQDAPVSFVLLATDSDGDDLTFSIVSNPSNGVFTGFNHLTGEVIYTPNKGFFGTDSFTFKANDGKADSNVAKVTITVKKVEQPKNNPPKITSTPVTMVNEKKNYVYQVTATDADGDVLTFSLLQAPDFLKINSVTGLISGTAPEVLKDTVFGVKVQVSDGKGGIATQSYVLTVKDVKDDDNDKDDGGRGSIGIREIPTDPFDTASYLSQFEPNTVLVLDEETIEMQEQDSRTGLGLLLFALLFLILLVLIVMVVYLLRM